MLDSGNSRNVHGLSPKLPHKKRRKLLKLKKQTKYLSTLSYVNRKESMRKTCIPKFFFALASGQGPVN